VQAAAQSPLPLPQTCVH